jgi:hypothetical protein
VRVIAARQEYTWHGAAFALTGGTICAAALITGEKPSFTFIAIGLVAGACVVVAQRRRRRHTADIPRAPEATVVDRPRWTGPLAWAGLGLAIGAFSLAVDNGVMSFGFFWLGMGGLYGLEAQSIDELERRSGATVARARGVPRRLMLVERQS